MNISHQHSNIINLIAQLSYQLTLQVLQLTRRIWSK